MTDCVFDRFGDLGCIIWINGDGFLGNDHLLTKEDLGRQFLWVNLNPHRHL